MRVKLEPEEELTTARDIDILPAEALISVPCLLTLVVCSPRSPKHCTQP